MRSFLRIICVLLHTYLCLQIGQTAPCKFDERCQCSNTKHGYVDVDCSLKNITKIPNLPESIVFLNVSHNLIERISKGTFEAAKHLLTLDLSFNSLSSINLTTFADLKRLRYLSLDNNELVYSNRTFPEGIFKQLKSLSHLSLKNNNLWSSCCNSFPDKTISDLSDLETLELDVPPIKVNNTFGEGYNNLTKLKSLVLGNNLLFDMTSTTFINTRNLQNISLHGISGISFTIGTFRRLRYLKHLEITFDSKVVDGIKSPIENMAGDLTYTSIETLKLGRSLLPLSKFPLCILNKKLYTTNITEIYITDNVDSAGYSKNCVDAPSPSLKFLDLTNNGLTRFMFDIRTITRLNLKQNLLGAFLSKHSYYNYDVKKSSIIKYIDISQNDIKELSPFIFDYQPSLKHIDLSNNKIQDITFRFSHLEELEFLNLSCNEIKNFDTKTMRVMNKLFVNKPLTIDLSKNTLQCTCKTISFLRWMIESNVIFVDLQEYTCTLEDSSIIRMNPFQHKVLQLEKSCKSYLGLITGVSLALLAIIMTVTGSLMYRYRWKIRYMYYMTKGKYSYQNISPTDDDEYTYDAFISYSDDGRSFVLKDCIEKLEKEENFRLCIHQRDFMPGQDITVNITNCIHTSRSTVCLITRKFLESYYCMFEFNMARMESIYSRDGRNILFLVFYEQILPKELPLVMLELVQKESYIEYPNDEQGNVVFWEKIKKSLRTNVRA
ncbi:toll-like receptor 4 [Mytilus galloprovincialis]|uniref:toll-like receptor 4 n=1 Tax=Mytilus galloprovincialis TaxID=29158 RepID=UPI003F7B3C6C